MLIIYITIEIHNRIAPAGSFVDYSVYCDACQRPNEVFSVVTAPQFLGGHLEFPLANKLANQHELTLGKNHNIRIEGYINDEYYIPTNTYLRLL